MHAWKPGDEAWARYYDWASSNYVARLDGHVIAVGRDGFTVRRLKPDHQGRVIERWPHTVVGIYPSGAHAEADIAANPFSVGLVKREHKR